MRQFYFMFSKGEMMKKTILISIVALVFVACSSSSTPSNKAGAFGFIDDFTKQSISKEAASKIAVIVPEKVLKSYSNIIINSSIAYMLRQKASVSVDVFLIGTEDDNKIKALVSELGAQDYRFVVAGFTIKGANVLANLGADDLYFFIPTLHKNSTNINASNIYFGGIDYDAQIQRLLSFSNNYVASFYDDSALSSTLNQKLIDAHKNTKSVKLNSDKTDFEMLFRRAKLDNASIFFNTPLVKSAILGSQIRANEVAPYMLLSTQISYNPILLSLTQPEDRMHLLIANSIANNDAGLSFLNEMLGHSVDYNWVVYATNVGLDYFYTQMMNTKSKRLFKEEMQNNQILYSIRIMKALETNFSEE